MINQSLIKIKRSCLCKNYWIINENKCDFTNKTNLKRTSYFIFMNANPDNFDHNKFYLFTNNQ